VKFKILAVIALLLSSMNLFSQDPNFHIYLCFGQSNMEGQGAIQTQDRTVDSRFKVMQALDCPGKVKNTWRTATPPLCNCYSGLGPADYFGRTMVANLPDSITIGVINVAIGGCDIRIFDKDIYKDYDSTYTESWFTDKVKAYGGNPYKYLMELAKLAQNDGVIKGILLHQGETNTGDSQWPTYVSKIYNNMLTDLSLDADSTPLLAGEVVYANFNGCCSSMNSIIRTLPNFIANAHIISASDLAPQDNAHFNSESYRIFGKRYASKMLSLKGYESIYFETKCTTLGENTRVLEDNTASNNSFITATPNEVNPLKVPINDTSIIQMNFTITNDSSYYLYGRCNNVSLDNSSYWIKIDEGNFELIQQKTTNGWQWLELNKYELIAGEHSLSLAISGNSSSLDKLAIKSSQIAPTNIAEEASNVCNSNTYDVSAEHLFNINGYALLQNHPNPVISQTTITFKIPVKTEVSLKIFDIHDKEITELAGKKFESGTHSINYSTKGLPTGFYLLRLKTKKFESTRKMTVLNN